jgi:hypothetical protein
MIGLVYCYTFYVTSFLSVLSVAMLFGDIDMLRFTGAQRHCAVPLGKLAADGLKPAVPLSFLAVRSGPCASPISRVALFVQA